MAKDALGDEIAHHIRDLGMPRDQAIAAAYSEEERGHKVAKNVSVATGLSYYDQGYPQPKKGDPAAGGITPTAVSATVKKAASRRL